MAKKITVLSEDDLRVLQKYLDLQRGSSANTPGRQGSDKIDHEEMFAPEVYIARTPPEGIPALVEDPSTGTGNILDTIGYADCRIYRIREGLIKKVSQTLIKRVYNLTTIPILGDAWVVIARDKLGRWVVVLTPSIVTHIKRRDAEYDPLEDYEPGDYVGFEGSTYQANNVPGITGTGTVGEPGVDGTVWELIEEGKLRGVLYSLDLVAQEEPIWIYDANRTASLRYDTFYQAIRATDYKGWGHYITDLPGLLVVTNIQCINDEIVVTREYI